MLTCKARRTCRPIRFGRPISRVNTVQLVMKFSFKNGIPDSSSRLGKLMHYLLSSMSSCFRLTPEHQVLNLRHRAGLLPYVFSSALLFFLMCWTSSHLSTPLHCLGCLKRFLKEFRRSVPFGQQRIFSTMILYLVLCQVRRLRLLHEKGVDLLFRIACRLLTQWRVSNSSELRI
jgi:hypothetical protein